VDYECASQEWVTPGPGGMRDRLFESMPTVMVFTPGYLESHYCLIEWLDFYLSSAEEKELDTKVIRAFDPKMKYCLRELNKHLLGEDFDLHFTGLFAQFLKAWDIASTHSLVWEKVRSRLQVDMEDLGWQMPLARQMIDATLDYGEFVEMNLDEEFVETNFKKGNWRGKLAEAVTKVVKQHHTPAALRRDRFHA
ncbi:MAG TPA: hypothetical protein VGE39_06460, partial [Prosthecobacter sp.]